MRDTQELFPGQTIQPGWSFRAGKRGEHSGLINETRFDISSIMAIKRVTSDLVGRPQGAATSGRTIRLTLAQGGGERESKVFSVALSELIAYSEEAGRTRLNLTKMRVLEVAETTGQIDQLVRAAAREDGLAAKPV